EGEGSGDSEAEKEIWYESEDRGGGDSDEEVFYEASDFTSRMTYEGDGTHYNKFHRKKGEAEPPDTFRPSKTNVYLNFCTRPDPPPRRKPR
ncbi:unnamed protein product, partial [Pylaiella littoralis]